MQPTAAVLSLLLCGQFAQFAPQAQAPASTGGISGVLTSADRGLPVRKATVRITSTSPRIMRTATTDVDGRFAFSDLPAAEYSLLASRSGYLDMVRGARVPGATSQGTLVPLAAGQKLDNISWTLPRAGVITGTILDEYGDPAFNVPVRAMRFVFANGFRTLTSGGNGITDDRGTYRIAGLAPGEYLVAAVPRDNIADTGLRAEAFRDRQAEAAAAAKAAGRPVNIVAVTEKPDTAGYVPTYFPGTPHGSTAAPVRVGISEEVAGIDIKLPIVQTASVSGRLTSIEGGVPVSRLQLVDANMPMSLVGIWFRDVRADGTFTFPGVVPGTYIVKAFGTPGGPKGAAGGEMWATAQVNVDERGTSDVTLTMQRGVTVSGRVAVDDLPPDADRSRIRASLYPITSPTDWEMASVPLNVGASGAFTATNVLPGMYRVTVSGLPDQWTIGSAMFGDHDAADYHLTIDGSRDVTGEIGLTSKTGSLTGVVSIADGSPAPHPTVIVFPANQSLWLPASRRIQLVQPGGDGRYTARMLPPGDYRVAALLDPEPGRHFDPTYLAQIASTAAAVTIGPGETRTLDLRVR